MFIPIQFILAFEIYDAIRSNMIDNILLKNLLTFSLNDKITKKSWRLFHYDEKSNE